MKSLSLSLSVLLLTSLPVHAVNYCVATTGDDRNSGTSPEQAFASIQRAVDIMRPGDTCYIRGGEYRETIDLSGKAGYAGKAITLTNYKDEVVTLDGTVRIDGEWTLDAGNVYKTILPQNITQLFVDRKLMTLARFPNALAFSDAVWHRTAARCQKSRESTNGHVIDAGQEGRSLAPVKASFNGCVALLNFGAHATAARLVENHTAGSGEFDYSPELKKYKTTLNYFFEGGVGNAERALLDSAQEWAYDESTRTLYLWAEGGQNPTGREIYGKVQTFAIVGDAATQHIVIDGLDFFATAFSFSQSDHITIRNADFSYYAASKRALGVLDPSETAQFTGTADDFCSDITVYNCSFHTACGLLHTDGSSMYMPDDHAMESVIRYNWFIGNGQRDFRWDGNNRPLLGVHGNLYRNVAMDTGVKRMSPSGGNGFRVKYTSLLPFSSDCGICSLC